MPVAAVLALPRARKRSRSHARAVARALVTLIPTLISPLILLPPPTVDCVYAGDAPAPPTVVHYRIDAGSTIDLGWTGIAHRQSWPAEQPIDLTLTCAADGTCAATGGEAGAIFGAPVPLSTGGVPTCVVSRLREPLSGHVGATTGCGELRLTLSSTVYSGIELARPCPICIGDRTPNDGRSDGRCSGGASPGQPCDANGVSKLFGSTSNACLPVPGAAIGTLAIDLAPLTTGSVHRTADGSCAVHRNGMVDHCYCPRQPKPNECDSGRCDGKEICAGPTDGVCDHQPFRSCNPGSGASECEALFAGAGVCRERIRPCFNDTMSATGACDRAHPTYVALFCVPATLAAGVNNAAGLPGPARVRLALRAVPAPVSKVVRHGKRTPPPPPRRPSH